MRYFWSCYFMSFDIPIKIVWHVHVDLNSCESIKSVENIYKSDKVVNFLLKKLLGAMHCMQINLHFFLTWTTCKKYVVELYFYVALYALSKKEKEKREPIKVSQRMSLLHPEDFRVMQWIGKLVARYRCTDWVWEITGWNSRLQEIADQFRGIYRIYLKLIRKNQKMSTCNRLALQTLGSRPVLVKILPKHGNID